jgi:hypothetical protein
VVIQENGEIFFADICCCCGWQNLLTCSRKKEKKKRTSCSVQEECRSRKEKKNSRECGVPPKKKVLLLLRDVLTQQSTCVCVCVCVCARASHFLAEQNLGATTSLYDTSMQMQRQMHCIIAFFFHACREPPFSAQALGEKIEHNSYIYIYIYNTNSINTY